MLFTLSPCVHNLRTAVAGVLFSPRHLPLGFNPYPPLMEESSDKMWSTGEGNGKSLQYSYLENTINSMKRQKDMTLKDELRRSVCAQYTTEKSGEKTPERIKRRSQSANKAQFWMWLVMEVKSDAVKNNTAQEPGMLGPWIKVHWKWSNRRWQEWTPAF